MIIKQFLLDQYLRKNSLSGTYLLIGPDYFLINQTAERIRRAWQLKHSALSEIHLSIDSPADWENLEIQSSSHCLFSTHSFIDLRYTHKTIDPLGKATLSRYITAEHPTDLLVIRAPYLTMNQLSTWKTENNLYIIAFYPLNARDMQQWIRTQFQHQKLQIDHRIPALISEYTQGNMAACSQAVEKIMLVAQKGTVSLQEAQSQLFDQSQYQLSQLSEAWLLRDVSSLLRQLEHAYIAETEPRVILWILTQDIRQLLQLMGLIAHSISFEQACRQLNIWSTKTKAYQYALNTKSKSLLVSLLKCCQQLDQKIKTGKNTQAYQWIEQISTSLCINEPIGPIGSISSLYPKSESATTLHP